MTRLGRLLAALRFLVLFAAGSVPAAAASCAAATNDCNYGARHKFMVIPACGHNARCVFTAETALPILFPQP